MEGISYKEVVGCLMHVMIDITIPIGVLSKFVKL